MSDNSGVIRHIAWRDLFPWLILFRVFRIAISPSSLAAATLAVLLMPVGWRVAGRLFLGRDPVAIPGSNGSDLADAVPAAPRAYFPSSTTAILDGYFDLTEPFGRFFDLDLTLSQAAYYALGALWTLALWAFPGAYITRRAVVQLATESAPDMRSTARYAGRRYAWYLLAPLYPLLGIILLSIPIALLGLLIRIAPSLAAFVAGLLWIFVVIAGLAAMWLFGGVLLGWPLMWPTISAERDGDPFEAFSRSYSYVYGRPLHYFFYVVIAAALGALSWAVVSTAGMLVQEFGFWALSWGAGGEAVERLRTGALAVALTGGAPGGDTALWRSGETLIGLTLVLIQAAVNAFRYTYFFVAATAIYLLLRQDVDEAEMDEIYVPTTPAPVAEAAPPAVPPPAVPPPAVPPPAVPPPAVPPSDVPPSDVPVP